LEHGERARHKRHLNLCGRFAKPLRNIHPRSGNAGCGFRRRNHREYTPPILNPASPNPTPDLEQALPCLWCGHDLRTTSQRHGAGFADITCTECGRGNSRRDLHLQGWSRRDLALLAAVVLLPPALLVATGWFFAVMTRQNVHLLLSLFLAPAVIASHAYAVRQAVNMIILLPHPWQRRARALLPLIAALIDVAACVLVAQWLW
jgi:hypothetical protein